ncbi:MAG: MFS transporter [Candidatus Thorarchaeota archaeon]
MSAETTKAPGAFIIVLATSFGVFLGALDSSIVNVSLYTMTTSLGVDIAAIQWIVVAYLLVITSIMPLMGKFGDRFGKTKIFQVGMVIFIIGSFFCAISPNLMFLISSRVFQAIGASMMTANGLALVTYFTTPENRGRAIGMTSVILAAALALGPAIGGILSQYYGWPSIFLVNIPIGIIGLIVVQKIIPATKKVEETKFDTIGAALFFLFLFSFIYYLSIISTADLVVSVILIAVTIISFILFILRERRFSSPIIPTKVLADRRISTSIFSALLSYMAIMPIAFLLPFYLQEALGFDQFTTGLFLISHPLIISIAGPIAGFISERVKARIQTVAGLTIQVTGLFFVSLVMPDIFLMIVGIIIMGLGLSLFTVANGNFIMTSAPKEYMGVVSALTNLSRTTGFSSAIAIVTSMFSFFMVLNNPSNATSGPLFIQAYTQSIQYAIWIFCVLVLLAAVISAFRGLSPAEEDREAAEISTEGKMLEISS